MTGWGLLGQNRQGRQPQGAPGTRDAGLRWANRLLLGSSGGRAARTGREGAGECGGGELLAQASGSPPVVARGRRDWQLLNQCTCCVRRQQAEVRDTSQGHSPQDKVPTLTEPVSPGEREPETHSRALRAAPEQNKGEGKDEKLQRSWGGAGGARRWRGRLGISGTELGRGHRAEC